ncbi:hypothetical protein N7520_009859 [Penicillium odoratum]|uniref:uncharacterized protein n=1 Tax=Penicillium odoratum TaxID=1167516 RepID=UPI002546DDA3|nr:uncharacterized protein N7520_009859 [Penicillium odoratum]KAJ5752942.1 hypothetical protein N7520_009859 [Penicillium odoratum]
MAPQKLQYIINFAPGTEAHTAQLKAARSHVARATHAKERRQRTLQYQTQKRGDENGQIQAQQDVTGTRLLNGAVSTPEIVTLLSASRRDPFMSYAKTLQPIEEMLFDHCICDEHHTTNAL